MSSIDRDEERLLSYLAGEGSAEERRAFEQEALDRDDWCEALYAARSLNPLDSELAAAVGASTRSRSWQDWGFVRWAVPLALAAAVVLIVVSRDEPARVMRGSEASLALVSPVGSLQEAPQFFIWTGVPGATSYRFQLFDSSVHLVAQTVTADTILAASALLPEAFLAGSWKVIPIHADGSEGSSSAPAHFHF